MANNIDESFGPTPNLNGLNQTAAVPPQPDPSFDPNYQNNCNAQTQGQQEAPDFLQIARRAVVATAMSPKGVQYIKDLKDTIKDKSAGKAIVPEIIPLSYPPETLCIKSGNNAYLLIFSEAQHKEDNLPTVALERIALQSMQAAIGKNVLMYNAMVVTPEDYDRGMVMGAWLVNALTALSSPEVNAMTIDSMKKYQLEISTNPANYVNFNNRFCPHGIEARADLKLTVSLQTNRNRNNNNWNLFDQVQSEKTEIGTIGAYVIFTENPNGPKKYIPEVHISSIVTSIQADGLVPLMLAIATETLIDNQYWKIQFSDLGPQCPNIGNLEMDITTGAPFRVDNLAARDQFMSLWVGDPVLILDVEEGRARIPGIERYALANTAQSIIDTYNKFLNTQAVQPGLQPCSLYANEYTGYVPWNGVKGDSRWCSYLEMMIYHSQNKAACDLLLHHYRREEEQVNIVRRFFPELELYYVNHMVVLNAQVIRAVQAAVKQAIRTVNGNAVTGTIDTSVLLTAGAGFKSSPTGVVYSNTTNPFNQIYGLNGMQPTLF